MPHQYSASAIKACAHCGQSMSGRYIRPGQSFCSRRCSNQARLTPIAQRFWANVDRNGPVPEHRPHLGACWIWVGQRTRRGYGQVNWNARSHNAHRVAYILAYGPVPLIRPEVTHLCDGGSIGCVRPRHLMADTHANNQAAMARRGRSARGIRNWPSNHQAEIRAATLRRFSERPETFARGERAGGAKLTENDVREIRRLLSDGTMTGTAIAQQFQVDSGTISQIRHRKTWAHVI